MAAFPHPASPEGRAEALTTAAAWAGRQIASETARDPACKTRRELMQDYEACALRGENYHLRTAVQVLCDEAGQLRYRVNDLVHWLKWAMAKLKGFGFPQGELSQCDVVLARAAVGVA